MPLHSAYDYTSTRTIFKNEIIRHQKSISLRSAICAGRRDTALAARYKLQCSMHFDSRDAPAAAVRSGPRRARCPSNRSRNNNIIISHQKLLGASEQLLRSTKDDARPETSRPVGTQPHGTSSSPYKCL